MAAVEFLLADIYNQACLSCQTVPDLGCKRGLSGECRIICLKFGVHPGNVGWRLS